MFNTILCLLISASISLGTNAPKWKPYSSSKSRIGYGLKPVEIKADGKFIVINGKRYEARRADREIASLSELNPLPPVLLIKNRKYRSATMRLYRKIETAGLCENGACYYR
jgi:hypothetical protein